MKNNINEFVGEITDNFSELFVETFFLRYLSDYDKNQLLDTIKILKQELNVKVNNQFNEKLKKMGYSVKNI